MFIISVFFRCVTSDFTVIEVTDVDFMTNNINTVQSMQIGSSSVASDNRSDIDLIVEDVDFSTPQTSKRPRRITSRYSNQSPNLLPVNVEPATLILTPITPVNLNHGMVQNQKDKRTRVEDAPDDEDEALIEPILEEVPKKTKSGRTSKK
ncbi:2514_t:CDS:2, partial [Gigaspora rosea]